MRPLAFLIAPLLVLTGCAEHRLIVPRPNPGGAPITVQSAAVGWGAAQEKSVVKCPSNIIDEVRVKQNVGQALLSLVTLGFYMPTTIEYVCGNVPSDVGSTEE